VAFLSCYGFGEVGVAFTLLGRTGRAPKLLRTSYMAKITLD